MTDHSGKRLFVGGYAGTDTPAIGITTVSTDLAPGTVRTDVPNAFHLALSPSGRTLYAASNVVDGMVYALAVDDDLAVRSAVPAEGAGTVHVNPIGRHLLATNHDSGTVAVIAVEADESLGAVLDVVRHTGSGPNQLAQGSPHPHQTVVDPSGRWILVPDKGNDTIYGYDLDVDTGKLVEHARTTLPGGVGPRGLVCHPDGRFVYVVGELSSTVTVCEFDPETGILTAGESVATLPDGVALWNAPSALVIRSDGTFLYCANRGHESIAVYAVEDDGARLRTVTIEQVGSPVDTLPWDLALDGDLLYVVNQLAGTVRAYRTQPSTGLLDATGAVVSVPTPACVTVA